MIFKELQKEIAKKFSEEDLKFYKEKNKEIQENLTNIPKDELFDYSFYVMVKDLKDIAKEDIGLLYIALSN